MLEIIYVKVLPFPVDVILSQYYDYEHVAHVHPTTLGEFHLVSVHGNVAVYEQHWPRRWFLRARSLVRQEFTPPNEIWFHFIRGRHKGVKVHTRLHADSQGTRVEERYLLPYPNWNWLRRIVKKWVDHNVERIWEEDLSVGICRGGWPGVPRS
ncbi:MAG: hypothetical protein HY040_01920 [Planctomycetes bacterium]|nr:hypothetical protein [Planctomycetota bacterium]